jgi:hypothetical protein
MAEPKNNDTSGELSPGVFKQTYFHGTKADLHLGDLIGVGVNSNYGDNRKLRHVYMAATLDAAIWGAELALGSGAERIYLVEPTGEIEDDPNLTNKKFLGNPTMSYRSLEPLRVVGEVSIWRGHPQEKIKLRKDALAKLKEQGAQSIED